MSNPSPDSAPRATASGKDLGDEYMVYDGATDEVHVLNRTARQIFLMCDGAHTVEQIAAALAQMYSLDPATARRDTDQTLHRLAELGLLTRG